MIRIIKESKEDIQSFIDKFGEENYNKVKALANSPTAKKMNLSDLTFCVSRYSKEWMEILLADCEKETYSPKFNKRFGGALAYRFDKLIEKEKEGIVGEIPEEKLDYKYWIKRPKRELIGFIRGNGYDDDEITKILNGSEEIAEENGWIVYNITTYLASEYYGMGSGWCICGAYPGSYDRGESFFNDYANWYCFIVNEEADERYCVFRAKDDGALQMWDGSHGIDKKVPKDNIIDLDEDVQKLVSVIEEKYDCSFEPQIPEDEEEQVDMILDELLNTEWISWISDDIIYCSCEANDVMERIIRDEEDYFISLSPEEQFNALEDYTDIMGDKGYKNFEDVPEDEAENLYEYSKEYVEAYLGGMSIEDYIYDFYGGWDNLSYPQRRDLLRQFEINARDVANCIVYDLREGYEWCEDIIQSREE